MKRVMTLGILAFVLGAAAAGGQTTPAAGALRRRPERTSGPSIHPQRGAIRDQAHDGVDRARQRSARSRERCGGTGRRQNRAGGRDDRRCRHEHANQKRDDHLRSADFFDAATIRQSRSSPSGSSLRAMAGSSWWRPDDSRQHPRGGAGRGRDRRRRKQKDGRLRSGATATGKISRKQFGLTWNNLMETGGAVVSDDVQMTIDVELIKPARHHRGPRSIRTETQR